MSETQTDMRLLVKELQKDIEWLRSNGLMATGVIHVLPNGNALGYETETDKIYFYSGNTTGRASGPYQHKTEYVEGMEV